MRTFNLQTWHHPFDGLNSLCVPAKSLHRALCVDQPFKAWWSDALAKLQYRAKLDWDVEMGCVVITTGAARELAAIVGGDRGLLVRVALNAKEREERLVDCLKSRRNGGVPVRP